VTSLYGGIYYGSRSATHEARPRGQETESSKTDDTPQKQAGRPQGPPSTIINLRIPLALLAQLDRYIDRLEVRTGLKANRGMIARRALELFLETRSTGSSDLSL
jgi:hypothetical protein